MRRPNQQLWLFLGLSLIASFSAIAQLASAADWPCFRGPNHDGTTPETKAPLTWNEKEHVAWRIDLPGSGNSSPIVVGDKVFVAAAMERGAKRGLWCYDRASGKELWKQVVDFTGTEPTHGTNPYAGSTPASDGRHVVVWHSSAGLYCYDLDGKELWRRDLGSFKHIWGYGSSPVIDGQRVYLNAGPGRGSSLFAIELASGKTIWQVDDPNAADDNNPKGTTPRSKWIGSWSTPLLIKNAGQAQLVVDQPGAVQAYDPADGKVLWRCEGLDSLAYNDTHSDGTYVVAMGGYQGPALGLKLGGSGDITATNRLWLTEKGNPQRIGSGVIVAGNLYLVNENGIAQCIELSTGKDQWKTRLPGGGKYWTSLVKVGDRLYASSQQGTTTVFVVNAEKLEVLAENKLDEGTNATLAVSRGEIFLKTTNRLYCIKE